MRLVRAAAALLTMAVAAAGARDGETVNDPELGFRLTVPDGFATAPEFVKGKVTHAFMRPPAAGQELGEFVFVAPLGGTIGRDTPNAPRVAAANTFATVESKTWEDFTVFVSRVPETTATINLLTFTVQAPLRREATQISVAGDQICGRSCERCQPTSTAIQTG